MIFASWKGAAKCTEYESGNKNAFAFERPDGLPAVHVFTSAATPPNELSDVVGALNAVIRPRSNATLDRKRP